MESSSWHTQKLDDIYKTLGSGEEGLSAAEAAKRLAEGGPNALPEAKTDSLAIVFLRQFESPLIYILGLAAVAVFFLGEAADGAIIAGVLLFNAIVGTVQEGKAQNTLLALKKFAEGSATVRRDGKEIIISDKEVVPGDILILGEGEKIPADARIIAAHSFKLDEAALTGESQPVYKAPGTSGREDAPASAQKNMVFKGTTVVSGSGTALAVATGTNTTIGRIAKQISSIRSEIPLQATIRHLSHAIIAVVTVLGTSIFLLGLLDGVPPLTMFATVISLTVSIVPEGLPIVMTLVLATGVWRMSKRNALIKKLQAVEALGQAQVIAVDKTGTLTKNEQVVREVWADGRTFTVGGVGYEPKGEIKLAESAINAANHEELLFAGKVAALSTNAHSSYIEEEKRWRVSGDPTEAALGVFGEKIGFHKDELLHESPRVAEIPFDYKLRYQASVHKIKGKGSLMVVGAPETIISLSTHMRHLGESEPLHAAKKAELERAFAAMSERGLRVVAYASREYGGELLEHKDVKELVFGGFFGMQDALRPEVAGAMQRAHEAGVRVVMITGDHKLTAQAIAKEAGIYHAGDYVLTGGEMDGMLDGELHERLHDTSVFARVTPEHKLRIINGYKKRSEIVAMTGDGVNDAPSLVAADLGVAMGGIGTEVAKEAADIVLLDDNFGSIVSAIEEGRSIYKTIRKVVLYLFSTSLGEVSVIAGALLLGLPLPLIAAQIIWLNLVTDGFLDVSLGMEPKEEGLLTGAFPKPTRYLVDSAMAGRMVLMALPMMLGTLFLFLFYFENDYAKAWTVSLTVLAVFQWFNAWNCRSERESLFSMPLFSNKYLVGATGIIVCLQLLAVYAPPLQQILQTVPLSAVDWLIIVPVGATVLLVEEARKFILRRSA